MKIKEKGRWTLLYFSYTYVFCYLKQIQLFLCYDNSLFSGDNK